MNRLYLIFLVMLAACQTTTRKDESVQDSSATRQPVETAFELTDNQKAEGWERLFDGKSLAGWHFYKNRPNNSWEARDGSLHCKPFEDGKENLRSDLITDNEYENFELMLEWKISPQGNSGIIYRATEELDQPYLSGPEYQILDDGGYPGETKETNMTACCYDMYAVDHKKLNPVGEWNTTKIVAYGDSVEHWLNGEKVLSYRMGADEWKKRKAGSKWKDEPLYGKIRKGHIDLQDHSHEVWFKNIMIRPIPQRQQ